MQEMRYRRIQLPAEVMIATCLVVGHLGQVCKKATQEFVILVADLEADSRAAFGAAHYETRRLELHAGQVSDPSLASVPPLGHSFSRDLVQPLCPGSNILASSQLWFDHTPPILAAGL